MTKREAKAEKQTVVVPKSVLDAEAAMQEVFAKHAQTDLDRLFNILKTVAEETRGAVVLASSDYLNSGLGRVYVEPLYKEFSEFSVHYFVSDIDTGSFDEVGFLSSGHDDYFGVGKDEDGRTFVRIWYKNIYEVSSYNEAYKTKYADSAIYDTYKTEYINNVIYAIKQFERMTESVLAFEKRFAEVCAAYENDKKLAVLAKSKLSNDELAALSRLGVKMDMPLSFTDK